MSVSQFIVSLLVGYITSWKLSLVITSMLPLLGLGGWFMAKAMEQGSVTSRTYEKAGGMAEEVLYQIKTVAAFANFEYEKEKYQSYLSSSLKAGIRAGFKTGFGIGFIVFVIYCSYALAVGYGTQLISTQEFNSNSGLVFGAGDVITVLFSIIFGCFSLGQCAPNVKAIYEATYAATEYFELSERKIEHNSGETKLTPQKDSIKGLISFKNVTFAYPSKPEHYVLTNLNVDFEPGKKIAICGQSGSGKSTVLSLIERFYEPNLGAIYIDDFNIRDLDLNYWRSLIGYVPQEPVLFNTTIRNNIIFGRSGVTEDEITEACNKAYAMEFVTKIGLDYTVGIKGSKLSGGQKQRIAIARAILKKPKLLILDEATSALDNKSEKEVQKALDYVSQGITTIVIAHKINTIINSDKIVFLDQGKIAEAGTHAQLIENQGLYYKMVESEIEKKRKKTKLSTLMQFPVVDLKNYIPEDSDEEIEEEASGEGSGSGEGSVHSDNTDNENERNQQNIENSDGYQYKDNIPDEVQHHKETERVSLKDKKVSSADVNISRSSSNKKISNLNVASNLGHNFASTPPSGDINVVKTPLINNLDNNLKNFQSPDILRNNNFDINSGLGSNFAISPVKETEAVLDLNQINSDFNYMSSDGRMNSQGQIMNTEEREKRRISRKTQNSPKSTPKQSGKRKVSSFKNSIVSTNSKMELLPNNNKEAPTEVDPEYFKKSRRRLMAMLKDNKKFVAGGMIAAACNGAVWPIYGVLLADAIGVLSLKDVNELSQGGLNVSMMFLGLAVAAAIVLWMQNYFFYGIGEILTKKFRELIYDKFLNFHMGFFDRAENSPGSLLTKLSADTTKINGVALTIIGQLIQTAVTLILGISLALTYQWKLCLINLCFLPLIIGNYVIQFRVQKGSAEGSENIEVEAGSILSESVINTKTIFSYNMQDKVVLFYGNILKGFNTHLLRTSALNGLLYGLSQFVIFGMYATLFSVGGGLYSNKEVTLQNMMRAIFIVLFTALGVGIAQVFVGDYHAAKQAIVSLYKIIDEPSQIDVQESILQGVKRANYSGKIEFRNVKFAYPTRPENLIFNGLNFTIQPGQNVAFVGASGSGKSTIISLIERFYDVLEGEVLIDDINIKEYDLKDLRKNVGIVMQEPVLFKRTIHDNIKYGRLDATDEEILQAAKDAYIDELLTLAENKDVPVSGGQKQRVAIARAILKSPSILLLDEATSALDAHSEELVKTSLNKLMKDRTSVLVAHR
jgi:ABC-type multidrug transport system fused ATPase/permease subunit